MRVVKFGGTSVADPESIRTVGRIVAGLRDRPMVLVFSAMGKTTDHLAEIGESAAQGRLDDSLRVLRELERYHMSVASSLLEGASGIAESVAFCQATFRSIEAMAQGISVVADFSPAVQDRLLGLGELLSTRIITAYLVQGGLPVQWVDARRLIVTDARHTQAEPLFEETASRCRQVLLPLLRDGKIPLTQGYTAICASGQPTTLGRGGSDFTAALIGAAIGAEEIQIWTDVDGILTADPWLVPQAKNIPVMSFQEAAELAFFGARVLHPKTLVPAVERGIPVRVRNTRKPEGEGTLILAHPAESGVGVKSIAYKEGMTVINLVSTRMFKAHGFLRQVFDVFDRYRVSADLVATSEVSVAIALQDASRLPEMLTELQAFGAVTVKPRQAVVCVVGERLKETPGIVGQVFQQLADVKVSMVSQGGSEINLSFVIDENALPAVVSRLHRRFFESDSLLGGERGGAHSA
ncbi:MAG: lysine-sensitive aspartokinase 3 [bacterium]|jgi:aspartate kinase|nr:lysine-sensitive aspartokinase 3 [candidate division KSB1 bacterium]MDH7561319.1 lysine-sensitive aspartokinase 3 [bacterium]